MNIKNISSKEWELSSSSLKPISLRRGLLPWGKHLIPVVNVCVVLFRMQLSLLLLNRKIIWMGIFAVLGLEL